MSDKYHLSNEQETYEHYMYHRSTESPTTTSSASSPMTTVMKNSSTAFNWQVANAPSPFDPVIGHYYNNYSILQQQQSVPQQLWSLPHPQQHNHSNFVQEQYLQQNQQQLLRQRQQHHHQLSYAVPIPPTIQGSSSYQHNVHAQQATEGGFIQHFSPVVSGGMNYATQRQFQVGAHEADFFNMANNISNNLNNSDNMTKGNKHSPPLPTRKKGGEITNKKRKKICIETSPTTIPTKYGSPSPNSTPLPSPIMSQRRKRPTSRRSSTSHGLVTGGEYEPKPTDEDGKRGARRHTTKRKEEEGGTIGEDSHQQKTVDQLENELAFLRDECATILIMLDSLRNVFLADIPTSTKSTKHSRISTFSTTSTINFSEEEAPLTEHAKNSTNQSTPVVRHTSRTIAQNPEMEREMRIAYDDLMLQVRQLEKKVEKLEGKSKSARTVEYENRTTHGEDEDNDDAATNESPLSQTSTLSLTPSISNIGKNDDDDDNDHLKLKSKKRRRNANKTEKVNTKKNGRSSRKE